MGVKTSREMQQKGGNTEDLVKFNTKFVVQLENRKFW